MPVPRELKQRFIQLKHKLCGCHAEFVRLGELIKVGFFMPRHQDNRNEECEVEIG